MEADMNMSDRLRVTQLEPDDQEWGAEESTAETPRSTNLGKGQRAGAADDFLRSTRIFNQPFEAEATVQGSSQSLSSGLDSEAGPQRFRPVLRPPTGVLLIADDNQVSADRIRLRDDVFVIGRDSGDIQFRHEQLMSRQHAKIERRKVHDKYEWYLVDLGSTNGTFVLAESMRLKDGDEIIVGRQRLQFVHGSSSGTKLDEYVHTPELVDVIGGHRTLLNQPELWLGRGQDTCMYSSMCSDPLLDHHHARLTLGKQGTWHLKDAKSLNGLWARVKEVQLGNGCWFMLGEQRFRIFFP